VLKITRKFDYAMVLLTDLGLHRATPSSARRISERYGLSLSLTANVLKGLQRRSLVRSTRGVNGGYILGRDPVDIRLAEVIQAIEGERNMTDCQVHRGTREVKCPAHSICPARGYVCLLEKKIRDLFDGATLADVLATTGPCPADRAGRCGGDHGHGHGTSHAAVHGR
jgi:Rrf2 family cysteine metabolism transcriptional repressor